MQTDMPAVYPSTVIEMLRADRERTCFEYRGRSVTSGETLSTIGRLARTMRAAGFGPGTGLAVLPGVTPDGFAAMFAAYLLGARLHAVRPGLTPGQLADLLAGGVDAVVVDPTAADQLTGPIGVPAYSLGPLPATHPPATDLLSALSDVDGAESAKEELPAPAGRPDDIARVTYTSGSTGNPKGCGTTYRALGADWQVNPDRWTPSQAELTAGLDRCLMFGTLSSPVVMSFVLLTLFHGGVAVVPDEQPGPLFPAAIARHKISASIMTVPRLYQMLDALRTHPVDVSSLRSLLVSGSPLSPHRLVEATRVLGPVVFDAYGQTEAGSLTQLSPSDLECYGASVTTSVGRPHPGVQISVRDPEGRPVADGATGEVYVRTPWQAAGYWQDPTQTAEVYLDGWVRTRDLGHLDSDGFLHLEGRTREIIIVNAMVYYAGPIERTLAEHPGVDQAYVLAVPDETTGEAVHALVIPASPDGPPEVEQLRAWVRERLGEGSVPARVMFIPDVIAAPSGKPDKRAMLARALAPRAT